MAALELFWAFVKIGFTSFGGLSMIPLISAEMLSHNWMTEGEIADIVAIAEMTPGPIGLNSATFAGIRVYGVVGAIAANLGVLTPTFTLCFMAAVFLARFRDSRILNDALYGIRPTCYGMIVAVMYTMGAGAYVMNAAPYWPGILIGAVAAVMLLICKFSIPVVVVASAVLGLLIAR